MQYRLPKPRNWQDFETLCLALWKEIWSAPGAQKNGRSGQPQNGVDIFGRKLYDLSYTGVQCKDKDENLGSKLNIHDVINESNKATLFQPQIKHFTVATTSPRDATIQKEIFKLSNSGTYPFSIDTWSWDDIEDELLCRPRLIKSFYNNFPIPELEFENKLSVGPYSAKDHLAAFFTREKIEENLTKSFVGNITKVAYELADNAYNYGGATKFTAQRNGEKIILMDNGNPFNPFEELDGIPSLDGNIGSLVVSVFLKKFSGLCEISYERVDEENKLSISFDSSLLKNNEDSFQEFTIDLSSFFSRTSANEAASRVQISPASKEVVLNVTMNPMLSVSVEYIKVLKNKLNGEQVLKVYLPRGDVEEALTHYIQDPMITFVIR